MRRSRPPVLHGPPVGPFGWAFAHCRLFRRPLRCIISAMTEGVDGARAGRQLRGQVCEGTSPSRWWRPCWRAARVVRPVVVGRLLPRLQLEVSGFALSCEGVRVSSHPRLLGGDRRRRDRRALQRDRGRGPTVILTHGNGGTEDQLFAVEEHMETGPLSARTRGRARRPVRVPQETASPGQRGGDRDARGPGSCGMPPPYFLVGTSAGGVITFMFAQAYAKESLASSSSTRCLRPVPRTPRRLGSSSASDRSRRGAADCAVRTPTDRVSGERF